MTTYEGTKDQPILYTDGNFKVFQSSTGRFRLYNIVSENGLDFVLHGFWSLNEAIECIKNDPYKYLSTCDLLNGK